jgi:zinc protease
MKISSKIVSSALMAGLFGSACTPAQAADIIDTRTAAGIRLVYLRIADEKQQVMGLYWRTRFGQQSPQNFAVASMAPSVLIRGGGGTLDGGAYSEELSDLAAGVQLNGGRTHVTGHFYSVPENIGETARLFNLLLEKPRLVPRHLERVKRETDAANRAEMEKPATLADYVFHAMLVGGQNPLLVQRLPENSKALGAVTLEDIDAWRRNILGRNNLVVIASGPLPKEEVEKTVDATFGGLPVKAGEEPEVTFSAKRLRKTIVVEHPVEQSLILTGQAIGWGSQEESWAASFVTFALGSGEKSRLFLALREKLGATYGTGVSFSELAGVESQRFLKISAYVANDKVPDALATLRSEYSRFIARGVTDEELAPFKSQYKSLASGLTSHATSFVAMTRMAMLNGEEGDAAARMTEKIAVLTPNGINALIRKHMNEELLTVIVTPSAQGLDADCVVKSFSDVAQCERAFQ